MIVQLRKDHDRHGMDDFITWTCVAEFDAVHLPAVEHVGYEGIETFVLASESILVTK